MKISSPAFSENAKIPKIYSKLGGNQRPPLEISDVPAEAKSLAIVCHDPDARLGAMDFTIGRFGICRAKPLKFLASHCPRVPSKG